MANIKAILYKFWNFWNRNPEAFEKELTIKLFFPEPEIYFHTKQKSDYLIFFIDWLIYWLVLNTNPSNISAIMWCEQIFIFYFPSLNFTKFCKDLFFLCIFQVKIFFTVAWRQKIWKKCPHHHQILNGHSLTINRKESYMCNKSVKFSWLLNNIRVIYAFSLFLVLG